MKIRGFTREELDGSFVYFIFSQNIIYIGETQKITFSRWVQHFYSSGTFAKKATKYGISGLDYFKKVNLISIELEDIRTSFPPHRWKTMTQAVEHSLHVNLFRSQEALIESYYDLYQPDVSRYQIVSDTSRTTPKSISTGDWKYANDLAIKIVDATCEYLEVK
jgi:hypothetical protein